MTRDKAQLGFTLVELLIVIAIIAVLIGILLPALAKANEQAHRVRCVSNVRQLTMAWLTYAGVYKGHFCSSETQATPPWPSPNHWISFGSAGYGVSFALAGYPAQPDVFWTWIGAGTANFDCEGGKLWPYLKSHQVYMCPNDRLNRVTSYQINGLLAGEVGLPQTLLTMDQIRQSDSTFVFIEGWSPIGWLVNSFKTPFYPRLAWNTPSSVVVPYPANIASAPGQLHLSGGVGGCAISFADGHVIYWQYVDPETSQMPVNAAIPTIFRSGGNDVHQLEAWSGGPVPPHFTQ